VSREAERQEQMKQAMLNAGRGSKEKAEAQELKIRDFQLRPRLYQEYTHI